MFEKHSTFEVEIQVRNIIFFLTGINERADGPSQLSIGTPFDKSMKYQALLLHHLIFPRIIMTIQ